MSTLTNITKIFKQSLKNKKNKNPQLHNKPAFKIFLVVPNFAKILTTVKIVKKTHAGKEGLIFEGLEAAIWKFDKVSGPR